jgi:hypothetical protein
MQEVEILAVNCDLKLWQAIEIGLDRAPVISVEPKVLKTLQPSCGGTARPIVSPFIGWHLRPLESLDAPLNCIKLGLRDLDGEGL